VKDRRAFSFIVFAAALIVRIVRNLRILHGIISVRIAVVSIAVGITGDRMQNIVVVAVGPMRMPWRSCRDAETRKGQRKTS